MQKPMCSHLLNKNNEKLELFTSQYLKCMSDHFSTLFMESVKLWNIYLVSVQLYFNRDVSKPLFSIYDIVFFRESLSIFTIKPHHGRLTEIRSRVDKPRLNMNSTAQKVSAFGVTLVRIQPEYGKIRTKITPNTNTFHAV